MPSFLLIGDLHFSFKHSQQLNEVIPQIFDIFNKEKPDCVVLLGDIIDSYKSDKTEMQKFLVDLWELVVGENNKHLWIIVGNHDRPNNKVFLTEDQHPFIDIYPWKNTIVAAKTEVVTFKKQIFTLVPYVENGRFLEALKDTDYKKSKVVFAHQEFKGCRLSSEMKIDSVDGDVYPEDAPLCISGHIHEKHTVGKNVFYTGTPYALNWCKLKPKKFVHILNTSKDIKMREIEIISSWKLKMFVPNIVEKIVLTEDIIKCRIFCDTVEVEQDDKRIEIRKNFVKTEYDLTKYEIKEIKCFKDIVKKECEKVEPDLKECVLKCLKEEEE